MKAIIVYIVALAVILGAVLVTSSMVYQDELSDAAHYKEMVCADIWPNYREIDMQCDGE